MSRTDILIFNVGMGQSVFVYPHDAPSYGMLIDCGNRPDFEPIDFLISKNYLQANGTLSNLTLTNYDQDHYSGLPYLRSKVGISTVRFAKNLSSVDLRSLKKQPHTQALNHACDIRDRYVDPAPAHRPPYSVSAYSLNPGDLPAITTNNLSQIVFVEHHETVICVAGDLEALGWKTLLAKQPIVRQWLAKASVFIASHHGRDNGHCVDVFGCCKPECIIISDKDIVHDTQEGMSSRFCYHVAGAGIVLNGNDAVRRSVLTTRSDGNLWIQLLPGGNRVYRTFSTT